MNKTSLDYRPIMTNVLYCQMVFIQDQYFKVFDHQTKNIMDSTIQSDVFQNPIFDSARARVAAVFELMTKPSPVSSEQLLYTCHKCGSKNVTSLAKQVRSCDEGTSVFNNCNNCGNKWRDG